MELRMALSTNATATTSTAPLMPINVRRRCLRVIASWSCLSGESEVLDHIIDPPQLVRIAGERLARVGRGGLRLFAIAEHRVSTQEAQPSIDVIAILFKAIGEPRNHAADHFATILLVHLRCCGDVGSTRPRRGSGWRGGRRRGCRRRLRADGRE